MNASLQYVIWPVLTPPVDDSDAACSQSDPQRLSGLHWLRQDDSLGIIKISNDFWLILIAKFLYWISLLPGSKEIYLRIFIWHQLQKDAQPTIFITWGKCSNARQSGSMIHHYASNLLNILYLVAVVSVVRLTLSSVACTPSSLLI